MTVDEICDEVKQKWHPLEIETTWREYISKSKYPVDLFRKKLADSLYGSGISETDADAFFQQAEKECEENQKKEYKEKEALEHARMYFG